MSHYYGSVIVECDVEVGGKGATCSARAEFPNPKKDAPYLLDREAIAAGWYIPISGLVRCPKHHTTEAARWGLKSLYEQPIPVSVSKEAVPKKVKNELEKPTSAGVKRSGGTK